MKKYIFTAIAALALAGCEKDPVSRINYLHISDNSFTFDATGDQIYTVTVESDPAEWDFTKDGEWFVVEAEGNELTITANANDSYDQQRGKITVSNRFSSKEIVLNQFGKAEPGAPKFRLMSGYKVLEFEISPNGKMAMGVKNEPTESGNSATVSIFDLATDEKTDLPAITNTNKAYQAAAVSDDGGVVIVITTDYTSAKYYKNGEWEDVPSVFGQNGMRWVEAVSSDGSVWVGCCQSGELYYPVKWVNEVPQQLDAPDVNGWGEPVSQGTMARGCSTDGSVIYGSMWDNNEAVYWKPDGSWDFVAGELIEIGIIHQRHPFFGTIIEIEVLNCPFVDASDARLSPNGKYMAMHYSKRSDEGNSRTPLFVDLETGEYTLLEDVTLDGQGIAASNEGLVSYGTYGQGVGAGIATGYIYDPSKQTSSTVPEWIKATYGINIWGDYYVRRICEGKNTVAGYKVSILGNIVWYVTTEGV